LPRTLLPQFITRDKTPQISVTTVPRQSKSKEQPETTTQQNISPDESASEAANNESNNDDRNGKFDQG